MIASIALALAATSLPACCIPSSPECELAEELYCAYQAGGPPDRAGLAFNGQPCPTWAELLQRLHSGDEGAYGVVAKWREVAARLGRTRVSPYKDGATLPAWGTVHLAGKECWHGLIRPTNIPDMVEIIEPAIDGDPWHLPLPERRYLRPIRGPMVYGVDITMHMDVMEARRKLREQRPRAEREAATSAVLSQVEVGKHAIAWEDYNGDVQAHKVLSITPPSANDTYWRVEVEGTGLRHLADVPVSLLTIDELAALGSANSPSQDESIPY